MRIMRACAGAAEPAAHDAEVSGVTFDELGYDSLAVLETLARLETELDLIIPEEEAARLRTPGELTDYVNARLAAAVRPRETRSAKP